MSGLTFCSAETDAGAESLRVSFLCISHPLKYFWPCIWITSESALFSPLMLRTEQHTRTLNDNLISPPSLSLSLRLFLFLSRRLCLFFGQKHSGGRGQSCPGGLCRCFSSCTARWWVTQLASVFLGCKDLQRCSPAADHRHMEEPVDSCVC